MKKIIILAIFVVWSVVSEWLITQLLDLALVFSNVEVPNIYIYFIYTLSNFLLLLLIFIVIVVVVVVGVYLISKLIGGTRSE